VPDDGLDFVSLTFCEALRTSCHLRDYFRINWPCAASGKKTKQ
jgi:hypothetical protein